MTCTNGTCDKGVCVTDTMKAVKADDPCDETFVEFCNGNSTVYCSSKGTVVIADCTDDGGCSIIKQKDGTKEVATAWCRGAFENCTDADATEPYTVPYCITEEYEETEYAYESLHYCIKNTENTYTAIDGLNMNIGSMCRATCNADNTGCEKLHPEEGNTCDKDTYVDKCAKSVAVNCDEGVVTALDCSEYEGYECVAGAEGASCLKPCEDLNDRFVCEHYVDNIYYSGKYVCENGYYVPDEESVEICYHGCNEDGTDCKKLHSDEGNTCDEATYGYQCDGSLVLGCIEGAVYAIDCGEGYECVETEDSVACMMPCENNTNKFVCEYSDDYNVYYSGKYVCKNGYYVSDNTSIEICSNDCNENNTACKKYLNNEGNICIYGEYKEKCTNGVVDYCEPEETSNKGKITAYKCDEGYTCTAFDSENYAGCVAPSDECTKVGQAVSACFAQNNTSYAITYVCTKANDGKLYYIPGEAKVCPNGSICNEAGTACAE